MKIALLIVLIPYIFWSIVCIVKYHKYLDDHDKFFLLGICEPKVPKQVVIWFGSLIALSIGLLVGFIIMEA